MIDYTEDYASLMGDGRLSVYRIGEYIVKQNLNDVFIGFKKKEPQNLSYSPDFSKLCGPPNDGGGYEYMPKFHISIQEGAMQRAWPHVFAVLSRHDIRNFKIVKPGTTLSTHSRYPGYNYEIVGPQFHTDSSISLNNKVVVHHINKTGLLVSVFDQEGVPREGTVSFLGLSENDTPIEFKSSIINLALSSICLIQKPDDQAGKDITIYLHSNPEKSCVDWAQLVLDITQVLLEKNVSPGYPPLAIGFRADKKIPGTDYVSYRYQGKSPSFEKDLLTTIRVTYQPGGEFIYQLRLQHPPAVRNWPSLYTLNATESVFLEEIRIAHLNFLDNISSSSEEATSSSSDSSSEELENSDIGKEESPSNRSVPLLKLKITQQK